MRDGQPPQQPPNHGPKQQGLFGPLDEPAERTPSVAPAAVGSDVRALAAALPPLLRLGTSSWNFPGWRGLVYAADAPAKHLSRHGLGAYARHPLLRTVGVDRAFYAPVPQSEFGAYAAQVPAEFRFVVKLWGDLLTPRRQGERGTNPRYLDDVAATAECVQPAVLGLGDKLGTLLLQFPPQGPEITREPSLFADCLHGFLDRLPKGVPYAVELRDEALLGERYASALASLCARHAFVVHPRMPSLQRQREVVVGSSPLAGPVVVRWMLHAGLQYEQAKERYEPFARLVDEDPDSRRAIAALAIDALRAGVPMTVVVNNKAEGSSPCSVLELARAIAAVV